MTDVALENAATSGDVRRDGRRPLAPVSLAPILERRVAEVLPHYEGELTLADLDGEHAASFNEDEKKILTEAVRAETSARWPELRETRPFPPEIPDSAFLALKVTLRTRNALRRRRLKSHLADASIGDLMRLQQFGVGSLLDVLTAFEADPRLAALMSTSACETGLDILSAESGYPSRGKPLAPWVLAPILRRVFVDDREAKAKVEVLSELDLEHSMLLSDQAVRHCAEQILRVTTKHCYKLAAVQPLRGLPAWIDFGQLPLALRTYNTISRVPLAAIPGYTIDDLMQLPNFGAKSLLDLLATVEVARHVARSGAILPVFVGVGESPVLLAAADDDRTGAACEPATNTAAVEDDHSPANHGPEADLAPTLPPRVQAMKEMYENGSTLDEIGTRFNGISRERVRQLLMKHEIPTRPRAERRRAGQLRAVEEALPQICELVEAGLQSNGIARQLGLDRVLVQQVIDADPRLGAWLNAFRRQKRREPRYSDGELLECLRGASRDLGGVLSTAAYGRFIRGRKLTDGRPWPTHQTPSNRFGSWRAALEKAGLRSNPPSPIAGQRLFGRPQCIDAILEVQRSLGRLPTVQEYEGYAAQRNGSLPSSATIRNRCGSWQTTLRVVAEFARGRD